MQLTSIVSTSEIDRAYINVSKRRMFTNTVRCGETNKQAAPENHVVFAWREITRDRSSGYDRGEGGFAGNHRIVSIAKSLGEAFRSAGMGSFMALSGDLAVRRVVKLDHAQLESFACVAPARGFACQVRGARGNHRCFACVAPALGFACQVRGARGKHGCRS